MAILGNQKALRLALFIDPLHQGHGFSCRGGFIEQGGIGQFHTGEVNHHLLKCQQYLQSALGNFRLVGRVGGIPARILQHVALDDGGHKGVVVPHTNAASEYPVLPGIALQLGEGFVLGKGSGQSERGLQPDLLWHGFIDQCVQGFRPQVPGHHLLLLRRWSDMAQVEFSGVFWRSTVIEVRHGVHDPCASLGLRALLAEWVRL